MQQNWSLSHFCNIHKFYFTFLSMELLLREYFLKGLGKNFRPNLMIRLIIFLHQCQTFKSAEILLVNTMSDDGLRKKAEHHDHSNFQSAFSQRIPILTLNTWKLKSFSLFFERGQRNALSPHGISRVGVHINLGNGMTRQSYQT